MTKKIIAVTALLLGLGCMITHSLLTDSLVKYRSKRNFEISPEPKRDSMPKKKDSKKPIFVIQKHDASHLHYDFRLEIGGVLKSWAIPKGPSTNPSVKRLAMETEDHPMEYAHFEGIIPEGYGAGTVMIWDQGTFDNIKEKDGTTIPLKQCYKNGQIEVALHGKKLNGGYALIRTQSDDNRKWLCIKMRDEYADARRNPVSSDPESVVSGKTIAEIAKTSKKKLKKT